MIYSLREEDTYLIRMAGLRELKYGYRSLMNNKSLRVQYGFLKRQNQ